jgi:riboflavin synthase alpha subunit
MNAAAEGNLDKNLIMTGGFKKGWEAVTGLSWCLCKIVRRPNQQQQQQQQQQNQRMDFIVEIADISLNTVSLTLNVVFALTCGIFLESS